MLVGKFLALALFGALSVNAQLTNTTILGILNTTQLSPATKFVQLLTSSEEYKPILDLLSNPGNYTVFVPSDNALTKLQRKSNSTSRGNNNGGGQRNGSSGNNDNNGSESSNLENASLNGMNTASYAILPENLKILQDQQQNQSSSSDNSTSSNNNNTTIAQIFNQGPYKQYNISDLLSYHIVNGSYMLTDLNHSSVLQTVLTNQTLDKNGIGMPIVVTNNGTGNNSQSSNSSSSSSSSDGSSSSNNQTSGSFVILQDQGSNSTSGGSNNSSSQSKGPVVYKVGNGWDFANVTIYDIQASNGILNVIDDVLLPPANLTTTAKNISQISALGQLAQRNQTITGMIQNATNITIFAPNNQAMQSANLQSSIDVLQALTEAVSQQEQIEQTVKAHIVQGVYYADNLTELASSDGSLPTMNGTQLSFSQVNATTVKVNNEATVVKPNVLLDNGVLHIINRVLLPQQQGGQDQQGGGQSQGQGQQGQGQQGGGQDQGEGSQGAQSGGNQEGGQSQQGGQEGTAQ